MSYLGAKVKKLLTQIKKGKRDAFKELFDLTYVPLCSVAKTYLKDKSLIEDVVSEAFIRVYKYINSYDEAKDGYNWLCAIVQNKAMDLNAKPCAIAAADAESDLIEEAENRLDAEIVLSRLNADEREIIERIYFLNEKYSELAKEKGCSESTLRRKVGKILKKLQKSEN